MCLQTVLNLVTNIRDYVKQVVEIKKCQPGKLIPTREGTQVLKESEYNFLNFHLFLVNCAVESLDITIGWRHPPIPTGLKSQVTFLLEKLTDKWIPRSNDVWGFGVK